MSPASNQTRACGFASQVIMKSNLGASERNSSWPFELPKKYSFQNIMPFLFYGTKSAGIFWTT